MKATIENTEKKVYCSPHIMSVKLDNDISLQLESDPPKGPDEGYNIPDCFNSDPYKNNLG